MTTEEKILEIINDELNAHNQSMPSLIARENIATKINFLFEQEFSEQKPDLNNQIDDIEKEDFLNIIFNELQKDAYDAEYHTYDFKRTNQIIRKYFEMYAQQFQKPEINLRDELIKFCEEYKSYYHGIIHLSKGGICQVCGYNKCLTALEFHHIDPTQKEKSLNSRGIDRRKSLNTLKPELDKCVLVCCRCHREIHENIIKL